MIEGYIDKKFTSYCLSVTCSNGEEFTSIEFTWDSIVEEYTKQVSTRGGSIRISSAEVIAFANARIVQLVRDVFIERNPLSISMSNGCNVIINPQHIVHIMPFVRCLNEDAT